MAVAVGILPTATIFYEPFYRPVNTVTTQNKAEFDCI